MNDYQRMRKYLKSLDEDGLADVMLKLGVDTCFVDDTTVVEMLLQGNGGQRTVRRSDWKKETIDDLLESREDNKSAWNSLCFAVGIDPDEATQIGLDKHSRIVAWLALLIALASLVVNCARG